MAKLDAAFVAEILGLLWIADRPPALIRNGHGNLTLPRWHVCAGWAAASRNVQIA